jgi:hypothetical protein
VDRLGGSSKTLIYAVTGHGLSDLECWSNVSSIRLRHGQQRVTESASPASLVSLYLLFMSLAV